MLDQIIEGLGGLLATKFDGTPWIVPASWIVVHDAKNNATASCFILGNRLLAEIGIIRRRHGCANEKENHNRVCGRTAAIVIVVVAILVARLRNGLVARIGHASAGTHGDQRRTVDTVVRVLLDSPDDGQKRMYGRSLLHLRVPSAFLGMVSEDRKRILFMHLSETTNE